MSFLYLVGTGHFLLSTATFNLHRPPYRLLFRTLLSKRFQISTSLNQNRLILTVVLWPSSITVILKCSWYSVSFGRIRLYWGHFTDQSVFLGHNWAFAGQRKNKLIEYKSILRVSYASWNKILIWKYVTMLNVFCLNSDRWSREEITWSWLVIQ